MAGGVNSNVGSYTPYFVHLSRKDTEQEITSYSLVLPKGITGKLAGIPFCPEAAIEAARSPQGFDETASPSCPAASQVGRTDTGYGVGPALTYAPGRIYLAGPYHGQPLSLVTINAATVGPFDLGTIVIRSAFAVDERTAQLADRLRAPRTRSPTSSTASRCTCATSASTWTASSSPTTRPAASPQHSISTLTGSGATFANPADDSTATVSNHFQLLNCLTLGFRPRLGLRLRGGARRGAYPSLRASFVSRGAQRLQPEADRRGHAALALPRPEPHPHRLHAGAVRCREMPGRLRLRQSGRRHAALRRAAARQRSTCAPPPTNSPTSSPICARARCGSSSREGSAPTGSGGILAFFDNLPDAPIDRFTMTLHGGRRGLLQNSSNICSTSPLATVSALGQNNVGSRFSSTLRGQCKKKAKRAKRGGHRR